MCTWERKKREEYHISSLTNYSGTPLYGHLLNTDNRLLRTVLFVPTTYIFSYISPLNTDTRIIRTLFHVPLMSVLTRFHCIWLVCIHVFILTIPQQSESLKLAMISTPYTEKTGGRSLQWTSIPSYLLHAMETGIYYISVGYFGPCSLIITFLISFIANEELCCTKVSYLNVHVCIQQNIFGFQVPTINQSIFNVCDNFYHFTYL